MFNNEDKKEKHFESIKKCKYVTKQERKRKELLAQIAKDELALRKRITNISIIYQEFAIMIMVELFNAEEIVIMSLVNKTLYEHVKNTPMYRFLKSDEKGEPKREFALLYCKHIKRRKGVIEGHKKYYKIYPAQPLKSIKKKELFDKYDRFKLKDDYDLGIDNKTELKKCKKCGQQGKGCSKNKNGWICIEPADDIFDWVGPSELFNLSL